MSNNGLLPSRRNAALVAEKIGGVITHALRSKKDSQASFNSINKFFTDFSMPSEKIVLAQIFSIIV